ncbi:MAG: hypothetical protein K9L66_01785 [Spirochaetaceae bacterium]|nr:hypothetical protein [Spirochaetaceae bacterium]MCF7949464.1 hypothetical protein [Spirochaetia bacterium]MCF7950347.1 hypothetical protein [Spirochaetaceae bacterium]
MNNPIRTITLLVILVVALTMPVSSISIHPEPASDYTPSELLENPETIEYEVITSGLEGDAKLASYGDFHVVFPVPLRTFRNVVNDLDSHSGFVPRMVKSESEPLPDKPGSLYTTTLRFKVLFIKAEFTTTTHVISEDLEGKRSITVSRLVRSHNDRISESRESWYLEAVEMNGKEHTYARYKSYMAYSNPVFAQGRALAMFGERDMQKILRAFGEEAKRRMHKQ